MQVTTDEPPKPVPASGGANTITLSLQRFGCDRCPALSGNPRSREIRRTDKIAINAFNPESLALQRHHPLLTGPAASAPTRLPPPNAPPPARRHPALPAASNHRRTPFPRPAPLRTPLPRREPPLRHAAITQPMISVSASATTTNRTTQTPANSRHKDEPVKPTLRKSPARLRKHRRNIPANVIRQ